MCEHCKDLTCCGRSGCVQSHSPRQSVAELLAQFLRAPEQMPSAAGQSGRILSRREVPDHMLFSKLT